MESIIRANYVQILLSCPLIWLRFHIKPVGSLIQIAESCNPILNKDVQSHSCNHAFVGTTIMKALNEWINVFVYHMVTVTHRLEDFYRLGEQYIRLA